jgi:hypothetical protein
VYANAAHAQYFSGDKIEKKKMSGACRTMAYTRFWWGNLRERDRKKDPSVDGRIILRWIFMKWDEDVWTGLIWLRMGTGDGLL